MPDCFQEHPARQQPRQQGHRFVAQPRYHDPSSAHETVIAGLRDLFRRTGEDIGADHMGHAVAARKRHARNTCAGLELGRRRARAAAAFSSTRSAILARTDHARRPGQRLPGLRSDAGTVYRPVVAMSSARTLTQQSW
jgi:hypothetical protein